MLDKLRGLQVHPDRLRVLKEKVTNLVLAALDFSPSMTSVLTPRRLGPRTDPARIRELLHGATVGPLGVLCDVGVHADHLDACGEAARAVAYARSSLSRSMPTLISALLVVITENDVSRHRDELLSRVFVEALVNGNVTREVRGTVVVHFRDGMG